MKYLSASSLAWCSPLPQPPCQDWPLKLPALPEVVNFPYSTVLVWAVYFVIVTQKWPAQDTNTISLVSASHTCVFVEMHSFNPEQLHYCQLSPPNADSQGWHWECCRPCQRHLLDLCSASAGCRSVGATPGSARVLDFPGPELGPPCYCMLPRAQ